MFKNSKIQKLCDNNDFFSCPETDCKSEIPPPMVTADLTPEEYERYETLSLRVCNLRLMIHWIIGSFTHCKKCFSFQN